MDDIEIELAIDRLARELLQKGKSAQEIEDYLVEEAERVAQEIRDGDLTP